MIKISVNKQGLSEIWDAVIEENGWVILENPLHNWSLYENAEHMNEMKPFKVYANHELALAIQQGQKWT